MHDLINESKNINNKLVRAANSLQTNISKMQPGLKKAADNLKWLNKDISEMDWYIRHWDIFGAIKSAIEGIYHGAGFADGTKQLFELFKNRTFTDLMYNFR